MSKLVGPVLYVLTGIWLLSTLVVFLVWGNDAGYWIGPAVLLGIPVVLLFIGRQVYISSHPEEFGYEQYAGKVVNAYGRLEIEEDSDDHKRFYPWLCVDVDFLMDGKVERAFGHERVPSEYWHDDLDDHIIMNEVFYSDDVVVWAKRNKRGKISSMCWLSSCVRYLK